MEAKSEAAGCGREDSPVAFQDIPALSDKSNPPPAQFAIANAIPEEFRILRTREVGHRAPTPKDIELEKELEEIRHQLFEAGKGA